MNSHNTLAVLITKGKKRRRVFIEEKWITRYGVEYRIVQLLDGIGDLYDHQGRLNLETAKKLFGNSPVSTDLTVCLKEKMALWAEYGDVDYHIRILDFKHVLFPRQQSVIHKE